MVTCSICYESTREVGELDCCFHRFCWPCINQWADRESRCPLCKQYFKRIRRKALSAPDAQAEPPSKRRKLVAPAHHRSSATDDAAAHSPSTPPQPGDDDPAADSAATAAEMFTAAADVAEDPDSPKGELEGIVLEERKVHKKEQVYMPEEEDAEAYLQDLLDTVYCMMCGGDNDDELLLICDGCDCGYHTYCVNRRTVPMGDWFCPACLELERQRQEMEAQHRAQRRGRHQQRGQASAARAAEHTERAAERRAPRQQRQSQQEHQHAGTRQAAARTAAPAEAVGRRRLRRAAAANPAGDDVIDLSLQDSDGVTEGQGTVAAPGPRNTGRRRGGRQDDDDFEQELQDYESESQDSDAADDLQDSDWEVQGSQGRRLDGSTGRSHGAAASGRGRGAAAAETAQAAGSRGRRTAPTEQDIHSRLARSAEQAGVIAAAQARAGSSQGASSSNGLKTWHQLRAEEEQVAASTSTASGALAAAAAGSGTAVPSAASTGQQLADLLRAVNQDRRARQSQGASSVRAPAVPQAGRSSSRPVRAEDQAWEALRQARSAARTSEVPSANRSSRAAAGGGSSARRAAGLGQRVTSGYFNNSAGHRQSQQQQQGQQDSEPAAAAHSQDHLMQALKARLQQQQRLQQRQQGVGVRDRIAAQLEEGDPRDPAYMDALREGLAASRDRAAGERRRLESAAAAASAGLPAGTVAAGPGGRIESRGVVYARRIASIEAAARSAASQRGAASAGRPAAAQQHVSRLALRLSAANQSRPQRQQQEQRQQPQSRRAESSRRSAHSPQGRQLGTGSPHGPAKPVASPAAAEQQPDLPRSARTMGAVKRGAAAFAAGGAPARHMSAQDAAASHQQHHQQQVGRQPLELQPVLAQQQECAGQPHGHVKQELSLQEHTSQQRPQQLHNRSGSRYFADQPSAAPPGQQHEQSWQRRLMMSQLRRLSSQEQQQQQQHPPHWSPVAVVPHPLYAAAAPLDSQHFAGAAEQPHLQIPQPCEHILGPQANRSIPGMHIPLPTAAGQQASLMQQQLLQGLQAVSSNTSNSSGTAFPAVPTAGPAVAGLHAASAAAAGDTPCSSWTPAVMQAAALQPGVQLSQPGQSHHSQQQGLVSHTPQQAIPVEQQQQVVLHVQSGLVKSEQSAQGPEVGELTYDQLKAAKAAAASIVKAKLRPLFNGHKISKDMYTYAAKEATHGLYEQVKQGTVAYEDVVTAAAAVAAEDVADCDKGVASVLGIVDASLLLAGVPQTA